MNDFLFGTQDAIAKGKVDGRVDKTRRASSETEVKKRTRKECDKSYDKQCKGKEIKVKTAPKKYEKETMRIEEANTALVGRNV